MKKILASLFVTSVAICSASAANAQNQNILENTSVHTGTIRTTCRFSPSDLGSLRSTPGSLIPLPNEDAPTSLSSLTSPGSFTVRCNSNHSFSARLLPGTSPTAVVERFRFINTPEPYDRINTPAFSTTFTTVTNLLPTPPEGYVVGVAAEASLANGNILPPGTYVINVEARVMAN
jgi:hypothetical protein